MAPRYDLNNHAVAQAELGKASSTTYRNREEGEVNSELVNRAIESQRGEIASSASAIDPQTLRTVTQLRVQAQGALLSLLPYGISYHELVAEGVDSRVLRSLYEDVGVKIPSPPPEKSTDPESFKSESKSNPAGSASQVSEQQKPVPGSNANTQPPVSATSETAAQKPLERKELIARMLAEKAAKKSEPSTTQSSPKGSQAATPAPLPKKPAAVPVRPKNKAQTDLARQRIEELKRQALLKSKLKAQPITNSNVEPENKSLESVADSKPVLHPLPVRPPAPQLLEGATIPGLSMAGSQAEKRTPEQLPSESQGVRVEPAPVARASQRKRPRASDFDEPEWGYKKLSNQEVNQLGLADRLVIDISEDDDEEGDGKGNDDDSIYGDNQDAMDVDSFPAGHSETVVTSSNSRPTLQKYPSGGRTSTSTPQGSSRPSDSEHIRQRDLEIQNMYRRIEELEQKRKAKLAASQIDSAQVTDGTPDGSCASSGSSAMQLSPVDGHATGNSEPASTAVPMPATGTLDETCAQDKAQVSNPTNEGILNLRIFLIASGLLY
ncbi:hypothetical protein N7470_003169 [Penicillium chermesinum]|nr:hypothetical protein N7470_003169 [Penicillium chermesinum]